MQDDLKDTNLLMHSLMLSIEDNIYFKDLTGRFVMVSVNCAKWYGIDSPEDVIGKTDFDIFTPEHAKKALADEQRIIQTGEPLLAKEEKETWDDGHNTWVSTSKIPLRNNQGKIIGTFGISRDITDHKNAEIQAARYAEENQLFRNRMEHELQISGELQKTFFPTTYPVFPEGAPPEESLIRFSHLYHAGSGIGGDFCSIKKISEREAGIFLCDVMGHGVRAALVTALIRGLVEEISHRETDPGCYLQQLNNALRPILQLEDEVLFATACYVVIDISTGKLRFANAGHPSPLILTGSDHTVASLVTDDSMRGPALALCSDTSYVTVEKMLSPHDVVFMYTDGIYEVTNRENEEFGEIRLMESTSRHSDLPLSNLLNALLDDAREFAADGIFDDDICLVGFHLKSLQ